MTRKLQCGAVIALLVGTIGGAQTAGAAAPGGASAPEKPTVERSTCAAAPAGTCRRGDVLRVAGTDLAMARSVLFVGGKGSKDNRTAKVSASDASSLTTTVPASARSGRIIVVASDGQRSRTATPLTIRGTAPKPALPTTSPEFALPAGKVFLDGPPATFAFKGAPGAQVLVELYDAATSQTLASWPTAVGADGTGTSKWDGKLNGAAAAPGRYGFRVAGAASTRSSDDGRGEFELLDHIFPIRGKHDLGQTETNNFGGGRNHGGQDLFARCGTPLVAARGGVVTRAAFQERAGYYVVITGDDGVSYVYMHLRKPSTVTTKSRVLTGQKIGEVGDTGRASGCHLHFELWTAPGWYMGGKAIDPLPELTRWDASS